MTLKNIGTQDTFQIGNGFAPDLDFGPRCAKVELDFSATTFYDLDFTAIQQAGAFSFLQAVFVDNKDNANALDLVFDQVGQTIHVPAQCQGCFPIIAPASTKCRATTIQAGFIAKLQFVNVPMPLTQWGPITVNAAVTANFAATVAAFTDNSGTIAVANTSQQLFAANPLAKRRIVAASPNNLSPLYINFGGVAALAGKGWPLMPGQSFDTGTATIDQTQWNIVGPDAAAVYMAQEA